MYIIGAMLLSGLIGAFLGGVLGFWGLIIAIPVGMMLGHTAAQMQFRDY